MIKSSPPQDDIIQILFEKIEALENKLQKLEIKLENDKYYIDIDPISIGTYLYQGAKQIFEIPKIIPQEAEQILILTFLRCGYEEPSRAFLTKIYTVNKETVYAKYIKGSRYGQMAISFSSENMWFPISNSRVIFVESQDIQLKNCHGLELLVVGYK